MSESTEIAVIPALLAVQRFDTATQRLAAELEKLGQVIREEQAKWGKKDAA